MENFTRPGQGRLDDAYPFEAGTIQALVRELVTSEFRLVIPKVLTMSRYSDIRQNFNKKDTFEAIGQILESFFEDWDFDDVDEIAEVCSECYYHLVRSEKLSKERALVYLFTAIITRTVQSHQETGRLQVYVLHANFRLLELTMLAPTYGTIVDWCISIYANRTLTVDQLLRRDEYFQLANDYQCLDNPKLEFELVESVVTDSDIIRMEREIDAEFPFLARKLEEEISDEKLLLEEFGYQHWKTGFNLSGPELTALLAVKKAKEQEESSKIATPEGLFYPQEDDDALAFSRVDDPYYDQRIARNLYKVILTFSRSGSKTPTSDYVVAIRLWTEEKRLDVKSWLARYRFCGLDQLGKHLCLN